MTIAELEPLVEEPKSEQQQQETGLPTHVRRAVVHLLRNGVVNGLSHHPLFETLEKYEPQVQQHLAQTYLKMTLDPQAKFALLQEQTVDDMADEHEEPVSLISHQTLSVYDTLVLLVLRKHFQKRELQGERRIYIEQEQIEVGLKPFVKLSNSSRGEARQLSGTLDRLKQRKVIYSTKADKRFEISPVIRYVVNADFLNEMLNSYLTLAGGDRR